MKISTFKTVRTTIQIGFAEILEYLVYKKLIDLSKQNVEGINVQVPGGGDWSNCKLDIKDNTIEIVVKSEERE